MKKTKITFFKNTVLKYALFVGLFLMTNVQSAFGHTIEADTCVLACNGLTNVSIDGSLCEAEITVSMVANVSGCPNGTFEVVITDLNGNPIPNATVTAAHVGQLLEVSIIDVTTGNYCWGNLFVEDKVKPSIDCVDPANVFCYNEATVAPPAIDNCDGVIIPELVSETIVTNTCDGTFGDEILRHVTRTYIATDAQGLQSDPCTIEYDVLRIPDLSVITEPASLLLSTNNALSCEGGYPLDSDGHPSPTGVGGTGVPTLEVLGVDAFDLYPDPLSMCNLLVTYEDTPLPPIGCTQKIMRMWTVLEWSCSNPQRINEFIQMIEITDSDGPSITCPANMTSSTNSSTCEATVLLPAAVVSDNCSAVTVDISYPGGFINDTNGGLAQLPVGENMITYTAYDECLNSTQCTMTVTVADQTPPVAVCDQNTVVALSSDGCAFVPATVFDDGSYDECSNVTISVRRMDKGVDCDTDSNCTLENDDLFDNQVRFCCADIGKTDLMVVMQVEDANGNVNQCMVNVVVQDKLAPTISCPADMTVNCDFGYDPTNADDFFGAAYVNDNCGNAVAISTFNDSDLTSCNIGTLIRTITVTDAAGLSASCTQEIEFIPLDPFNANGTAITWPADHDMDGCENPYSSDYDPTNMPAGSQFPTYTEGACDLVGASYSDQIFPFNDLAGGACFKIIRTWTVIDWCQFVTYNGATTYPEWSHVQIIKISDPVGPNDIVVTGPSSVCTFDADCAEGSISLTASSSDDCTQVLDWSYEVEVDNNCDGSYDGIYTYKNKVQSFSGEGNTVSFDKTYAVGCYKVTFTFADNCGNITTKSHEFSINSCKAPTPYLLNGLAVDLMDNGNGGGMITMWATDFDAGSSHPCGYQVYMSFDPVVFSPSGLLTRQPGDTVLVNNGKDYDCSTLGDQAVAVYAAVVTPMDTIIQAFANTTINIQDNMSLCSSEEEKVVIQGNITTASAIELQNAVISLDGADIGNETTNETGTYAFPLMNMGGNYTVAPQKNDDYTNGVSTLDLVMIQRHILEIESFDSPYKFLAADINNDEKISSLDLLQLRKLILGVYTELPNNGSWRFIDGAFTFADVEDPLSSTIPNTYEITTLNSDMNIDFVAVKVGDVSDNAEANLNEAKGASSRSTNIIEFTTENQTFANGDVVAVPVNIEDDMTTTGFQFTISIDNSLDFEGVTSNVVSFKDYNVHFANGEVTISYDNHVGTSIDANEILFEAHFVANANGSIDNAMNITSDRLEAEMYDENLDVFDIDFNVTNRNVETTDAFIMYQNTPNPFNQSTSIGFNLPTQEAGTFTVYDMTGKVVSSTNKTFDKGYNQITLEKSQLGAAGVFYYKLDAGSYSASKMMIMID